MQFVASLCRKFLPAVLQAVWRPTTDVDLVRLGSGYGGWWVPTSALEPGHVAFLAGAGEDITFDLELHDRGLVVYVFDPTPRAIACVERDGPQSDRFTFVPRGWWSHDDVLRFYAPRNPNHVSHSIGNLQRSTDYFEATVSSVATCASDMNVHRVDLIKMDIEGAEFAVLNSLLNEGPLPTTLCVEFDRPTAVLQLWKHKQDLHAAGYRLARIDHWNYTFVRTSDAPTVKQAQFWGVRRRRRRAVGHVGGRVG